MPSSEQHMPRRTGGDHLDALILHE